MALGRQAVEKRVVSQDLELWLSNAPAEKGYTLLARAGRQVLLAPSSFLLFTLVSLALCFASMSSRLLGCRTGPL